MLVNFLGQFYILETLRYIFNVFKLKIHTKKGWRFDQGFHDSG